jgi:hypothetical protein
MRTGLACSLAALSLALSGCEDSRMGAALAPAPAITGHVVLTALPLSPTASARCATAGLLIADLNLTVSATQTSLVVEDVTLHLIDGTNLGGPGVFPAAGVNAPIVNPFVAARSSRSFALTPTFRCGVSAPQSIRGDVGVAGAGGERSVLSATVTLR